MDTYEQVCFRLICNICPFIQFYEDICLSGIYHFHIFHIIFHELTYSKCDGKVYVLFPTLPIAKGSWVFSPMSCIQHQSESHFGIGFGNILSREYRERQI